MQTLQNIADDISNGADDVGDDIVGGGDDIRRTLAAMVSPDGDSTASAAAAPSNQGWISYLMSYLG